MRVSLLIGDITVADTDAICTSTNPHLSLVMGTGAAVRSRGGFAILRECEAIVDAAGDAAGLPPGSVHRTTAGSLPHRAVIHCVASDASHRSSEAIIQRCVQNAVAAAAASGCRSLAMPVFATGHARVRFGDALGVIARTIASSVSPLERVVIVINDAAREVEAAAILRTVFGEKPDIKRSSVGAEEETWGWWSERE